MTQSRKNFRNNTIVNGKVVEGLRVRFNAAQKAKRRVKNKMKRASRNYNRQHGK